MNRALSAWRSPRFGRWGRVSSLCVVGWLAAVFAFTNCSHTSPYVTVPVAAREAAVPKLRLLLLGDAGLAMADSAVLKHAAKVAQQPAAQTTAIYLGDNIYPSGLPAEGAEDRSLAEQALRAQFHAFGGTGADVIFVPGNHDWAEGSEIGRAAVERQEAFLRAESDGKVRLLPGGAAPGPECFAHAGVQLVFLNTQWWLHEYDKPAADPAAIRAALEKCLDVPGISLLFTHHPPKTHGVHGGEFVVRDHIFPLTRLNPWLYIPLPLIGSLYPLSRSFGISPQDVTNDVNQAMLTSISQGMAAHPPLVWAAGHEHSLQVLNRDNKSPYTLVSGSASKTSPISDGDDTLYAHEALGFMELSFYENGGVQLVVHAETERGISETFRFWLKSG
jgi:hypothetical protein